MKNKFKVIKAFVHDFIESDGIPVAKTSAECMQFLQDALGYSVNVAKGVLGLAVAKGFVQRTIANGVKIYF